ncbi:MAG TPA: T9SS type A sorting domain-containing protein [Candidatus Cloacimonetes bacterium]|nr:T9SS type A sorting domain-containing protein [Candidatus Cloacimonadota bacterium]HEX37510.1 T9SS type A sorting domain-containing protein [Candidatus Cloacimonadota bacterium]
MKRYYTITNKIIYIILFTFLFPVYLLPDSNSVSPTINDHIYVSEWSSAGLENGELSDDFPLITGTIQVDDPTGNDYQKIQDAINDAADSSGIWAVMLQPSVVDTYHVDQTIDMKSNVILCGPYQWKSDKDEGDRAIIEFHMSSPSVNCIIFDGKADAGVEDVYLKRMDGGETSGIDYGVTNNVYFYNNCIKYIPHYSPTSLDNNFIGWDEEDLLLADPSQNDLHLNYNSPLIDMGMYPTNSADSLIYELYENTDYDGNPRIVLDTIDIGCYEFFESGIYLPQKEIDFGSIRHDRTSTQDLIIKNVGRDNTITNIEISFEESIAEYYTVDENDIPTEIASGDSACILIEFCCHKMFVNCSGLMTITSSDPYMPEIQMLVFGSPALDNEWNWISFPALERDENGNQDAEEVLDILVPNAHQLITSGEQILYNGSNWIHTNLYDIESTVGYKLEMFKDYSCYPFPIIGDSITIISPDTEIHLDAGYNWIGYWLPQSQNFDEAFGPDHFEKVLSIQAENWYYKPDPDPPEKDFPGQSQNIPSSFIHPLHYGKGYIVELSDSINLIWNDPTGGNTKERGYEETEAFSYNEKETYEVIDVIGLDESIIEIGVLNTDDECLGATKVDSLGSAQILAYIGTQTKTGTELTFCVYQGRNIKELNDYLLYDFKTREFIKAPLRAGERKYNLVLFDSDNPQLLDKLILRQSTPNPFNFNHSNVEIYYAIPKADHISLKIYNIKGQLIKTLVDNDKMETGYYTVEWNGKDDHNRNVCNGVYLYKLENTTSSIIRKMIVLD